MKTIKISILAIAMVFTMQIAHAQISVGVRLGTPYHRVYAPPVYGYGYYGPAYYHRPYVYGGYYGRPVHHPYYRGRVVYRRR
jgi:hypothetical protein